MTTVEHLTASALKARGWTDAGIRRFLGEPDAYCRNPQYASAPQTAAREHQAAKDWALALKAAELFSVSVDMTRLAVAAGMALPAYRLHPEDLPATHGLLASWHRAVIARVAQEVPALVIEFASDVREAQRA